MVWKRLLGFLVLFVLFFPIVNAQEPLVSFKLLDSSGNLINHVTAHIDSNIVVLVNQRTLKISKEIYSDNVEIILDNPKTNVMDYYFKGEITTSMDEIVFTPIALVRGSVYDSLDNLLGNVDLEFDCNSLSGIDFPEKTDKFGGFSTYVPVGECKVLSTNGKFIGKTSFRTNKGDSLDLTLTLVEKINSRFSFYWTIIILLLFAFVSYKLKPKKKKKKKKVTNKLNTILKTLKGNEKDIMEFIILNNNSSTSSKIRHGLKIPKTSLSRILDRLESKKVIQIEREGTLKRVKISDWLIK